MLEFTLKRFMLLSIPKINVYCESCWDDEEGLYVYAALPSLSVKKPRVVCGVQSQILTQL